jgi:ketosteroid isomerase-like protein
MSVDENKAIARAAFDALMSDNLAPLDHLLAPDCILHQCGWLQPIRGVERIKHISGRRRLVSERHVRLDAIIAEGDTVAIHWHTEGLYADPGDPHRTGQAVSFMSMSFLRLDEGTIREIWNIQDMSTVWSQLGSSAETKNTV